MCGFTENEKALLYCAATPRQPNVKGRTAKVCPDWKALAAADGLELAAERAAL